VADVPHFAVPFTVTDGKAAVVEQDSIDDVTQSVFVLLATEQGTYQPIPDLGIEDPTFRLNGVDLDELAAEVEEFEPRAELLTETQWDGLLQEVKVKVGV
jgi:phage baseplate assembly protein W